jgi:hypothetical protein
MNVQIRYYCTSGKNVNLFQTLKIVEKVQIQWQYLSISLESFGENEKINRFNTSLKY